MKIAVIAPYFYPRIGGLENYAYHISKGLKEKYNWDVVVITSNHQERVYKEEKKGGITIYKLPRWFKISNTPINPLWYFQIRKIIKKEKPDVINAHSPVPFISDIAAKACGDTPFILTYHSGAMILKGKLSIDLLIKFYESFILRFMLKKAKIIICSSDYVRLNLLKNYSNKTITITPGVDINKFKPKSFSIKNKILFVSSLRKAEKYKGLIYLIYATDILRKKIKDVQLIVVGNGDYAKYYKKLCKRLKIEQNVEFRGELHGKKLVHEYQQASVFVLPSLFDSCPLVLLEAMACGKPIIGSNTCGIPYIIKSGENGLLFPPKDTEVLSEVIVKILKNSKLAKKMGENGYRKVIESYSWNKQIQKTKKVIEEVYI